MLFIIMYLEVPLFDTNVRSLFNIYQANKPKLTLYPISECTTSILKINIKEHGLEYLLKDLTIFYQGFSFMNMAT